VANRNNFGTAFFRWFLCRKLGCGCNAASVASLLKGRTDQFGYLLQTTSYKRGARPRHGWLPCRGSISPAARLDGDNLDLWQCYRELP